MSIYDALEQVEGPQANPGEPKLDYRSKKEEAPGFHLDLADWIGDSDSYIGLAIDAEKQKAEQRTQKSDFMKKVLSGEAINEVNDRITGLNQQITDTLGAVGQYQDPERGPIDVWDSVAGILMGVVDPQNRMAYAGMPYQMREMRHAEEVQTARQNYEDQLTRNKMKVGGLQNQVAGLQDEKGDLMSQQTALIRNRDTSLRAANSALSAKINARIPKMGAIQAAAQEVYRLADEYDLDPDYRASIESTVQTALEDAKETVHRASVDKLLAEAGKVLKPILDNLKGKSPTDEELTKLTGSMRDLLGKVLTEHEVSTSDPLFDAITNDYVDALVGALDIDPTSKELAIKKLQQQGDQFSQKMALEWAKAKVSAVSPRGKNDTGASARGAIVEEAQRGVEPGSLTTPKVSDPILGTGGVTQQPGVSSSTQWPPDVLKYMGAAIGDELRSRKVTAKITGKDFHTIVAQLETERGHPIQVADENHAKALAKIVVEYFLKRKKK